LRLGDLKFDALGGERVGAIRETGHLRLQSVGHLAGQHPNRTGTMHAHGIAAVAS
jgi:hypothetical protein